MKIDMAIKNNIVITVDNVYCHIEGLNDQQLIKKIDDALSFYVSGYNFTAAFKTGWWDAKQKKWCKWDGKTHLLSKNNRFPSGLLYKVEHILKNSSAKYEKKDSRKDVQFGPLIKTKNIEPREYQKRVLDAALRNDSGIIQAATGSGKSIMITQLVANTNVKTVIYVVGIDLLYQMHETFEKMLGTKVGIIGDGKADIRRINVCTVWTAANALGKTYIPYDDEDVSLVEKISVGDKEKIRRTLISSEMTIYDECHMLAAKTLQLINQNSKAARYKYGFSGTPWRDDNSDMLIEAVCGKTIVEITASELIKSGHLVKPKIYFVPISNCGKRIPNSYASVYKEFIVENDDRNKKIVSATKSMVKKGRRVLILVKNIKHGKILLSKLEKDFVIYFVRGSIKSDERNKIRKDFIGGKIDVIIASIVFDQGVDLPNLDALILAGSGKSTGRALQRLGRVIRPFEGKKDAIVLDFFDDVKYLIDHSKRRLQVYKRESEFEIIIKTEDNAKKKDKKKSKPVQKAKQWGKVRW